VIDESRPACWTLEDEADLVCMEAEDDFVQSLSADERWDYLAWVYGGCAGRFR